jgi:hypothetical protein
VLVQFILETTALMQPTALRSEVPQHVKELKMYWISNEWSKVQENLKERQRGRRGIVLLIIMFGAREKVEGGNSVSRPGRFITGKVSRCLL